MSSIASTVLRNLTSWIAGEDLHPEPDASEVQGKFDRQRSDIHHHVGDIRFTGGYRPREVLDQDEFDRFDLATLRAKVEKIDIPAVDALHRAWEALANRETNSIDAFVQHVNKAGESGKWRGEMRDAVARGIRNYAAGARQFSTSARLTSAKIDELRTGLEPTLALVPHDPKHRSGLDNARAWIAGRDWRNDDVARANGKAEALRVLRTIFAPIVQAADTNVPVLPQLHDPATSTPESGTPAAGMPDSPQNPPRSSPQTPSDLPTEPSSATSALEQSSARNPSTTTPTNAAPPTQSPQTPVTDAVVPANTAHPSGTPNVPSSGIPPSDSLSNPIPGGPAGQPNTPSPTISRTSSHTASRSLPKAAGMPGLSPSGARKDSEENSYRTVPDYLVNQENGVELLGLDTLAKQVPPVLGE